MKINLTRKTGFFGQGSPLKVILNGQEAGMLNNDERKQFDVGADQVELMVKFSFLRSQLYTLSHTEEEFQIKINPNIMRLYISLFTLIFILPILFKSWLLGVGILALYVIFVAVMSRYFYVIEETTEGATKNDGGERG